MSCFDKPSVCNRSQALHVSSVIFSTIVLRQCNTSLWNNSNHLFRALVSIYNVVISSMSAIQQWPLLNWSQKVKRMVKHSRKLISIQNCWIESRVSFADHYVNNVNCDYFSYFNWSIKWNILGIAISKFCMYLVKCETDAAAVYIVFEFVL